MQTANEIVTDLINNQPSHQHPYTQQQIETEFANEIQQYINNEIDEETLYEIISTAIDRHNF